MSTKEEVIRFIKALPENVTLQDILEELSTRVKIEKGLEDLNLGGTVSHKGLRRNEGNGCAKVGN